MTLTDKIAYLQKAGIHHIACLKFNQALATLTAQTFIEAIVLRLFKAQHLMVGEDFCFGSNREGSIPWLKKQNNSLELFAMPLLQLKNDKISSTQLRHYCHAGQWGDYYQATGHYWQCGGSVATGQKIARTLDCPTLNIQIALNPMPCEGIHAAWLHYKGEQWPALIYFAANQRHPINICEVHLLSDYPQHLALETKHLHITPLVKIRSDRPIRNLVQVKAQIKKDKQAALFFFQKALDKSQLNPA